MGDFTRMLNEKEIEIDESKVTSQNLAELVTLIDKGTISSKIAKQVFEDMFETGENAKDIVEKKGLVQMSDEGAIKEIVQKVVDVNPQSIADYKAGKDRAIGFLVGQIMKETKGKANPQIVNKLLLEIINK
jgi:aspartyl-tRNA(Asn)/glutamyl-tRNA(Gln) amidotransferase subunit B